MTVPTRPSLTPEEVQTYLKYSDLPLPRHTSYPAAPFWREGVTAADHHGWFAKEAQRSDLAPTSVGLYVHVPFCRSLCYYCGCTRSIVTDRERATQDPSPLFLQGLEQEVRHWEEHIPRQVLESLHLGGGTPTFLTAQELVQLDGIIGRLFVLSPDAETSAEVDPRVTSRDHLQTLWDLGIRRLSLGVQDLDETVQRLVNRWQPARLISETVETARAIGFRHINFDLIYGLPGQTLESMAQTLDQVIRLAPSRIAFYRLAVLPDIFKWQKSFSRQDLPRAQASLDLMLMAVERFADSGYQMLGFDHFALEDDPLTRAFRAKTMTRNFQGMTTGARQITIGLGPSAISSGTSYYAQNAREFKDWLDAMPGGLPTVRGYPLSKGDESRAALLQELYCYGRIEGEALGHLTATEAKALKHLEQDGLLTWKDGRLELTFLGRLLTRVVGSALDPYLPPDAYINGLTGVRSSTTG